MRKQNHFVYFGFALFAVYWISFSTAYAQQEPIITLDPINPNVEEGDTITFSGSVRFGETPLSEQPIIIKDQSTGAIIARLLSDQNGQFLFEWNAVSGNYVFYAELDNAAANIPIRSTTFDVVVSPPLEDSNTNNTPGSVTTNPNPGGELNFQFEDLWFILVILGISVAYAIYKYRSKKIPMVHVELKGGLET